MEKIYLRPNAQEILIKGTPSEGALDVFAYQGDNSESARHLGALYVVGNVQHKTDDMAYATNLIAALAKREYYSDPDLAPKDAFAAMLRKVNEVVEEFFKHDGLNINVGIFTVANEKISISKLGKFKIFLARDDKTIDILNNINLFGKEHVSQAQFSSVITGSVFHGDRLFAFYPGRGIIAREKTFKEHLPKLASAEFIEKLNAIKAKKQAFSCAGIYVDFERVKEAAVEPNIQPQELIQEAPTPTLAAAEKTSVRPARPQANRPSTIQAAKPAVPPQEMPRIIPSEFSLGRKGSFVGNAIHQLRLMRMTPQIKAIGALAIVAIVIVSTLVIQSSSLINSQARTINRAIEEAKTRLSLAKTRISQNDTAQARTILLSSILALRALDQESDKVIGIQGEIKTVLDGIDQAESARLSLTMTVPNELDGAKLLAVADGTFALYGQETASSSPFITLLEGEQVRSKNTAAGLDAGALMAGSKAVIALDKGGQKMATLREGKVKSYTIDAAAQPIAGAYYEDNLYLLLPSGVFKIPDASLGIAGGQSWLKEGVEPAAEPALIAVDGNIYVLSKTGTLTTYYQGEKVRENNIAIIPAAQSRLLTTDSDGANLYLVDRSAGRIHVIDKRTGSLAKTLALESGVTIGDAAITSANSLYILTDDGKVWKVE